VPGRITDELRRITREQGGASGGEGPGGAGEPERPEPAGKRYGPLIALAVVVLLAGVGWIVVQRLMTMSRMEDCAMSGRKNCAPIDTGSLEK
jgi:hypothetical protein